MQQLIAGFRKFHSHVFPQKRRLYAKLAEGQSPPYLFITCSDSRVDPIEFTQTKAGEMFVERSIGNLVPKLDQGEHEALAAIEYAVIALGVKHIIICGHTHCGAVKGLLQPESLSRMPAVAAWLDNAQETREAVARKFAHLEGDALLNAAIRENVVVQLAHLRRLPSVEPKIRDGVLDVHGWVYEFERGEVQAYDQAADQFVPLSRIR